MPGRELALRFVQALNRAARTGDVSPVLSLFEQKAAIFSFIGTFRGHKGIEEFLKKVPRGSHFSLSSMREEGNTLTADFEVRSEGRPPGHGTYTFLFIGDMISSLTIEAKRRPYKETTPL